MLSLIHIFHKNGIVSQYKKYDLWKKDFESKLPSYKNEEITFTSVSYTHLDVYKRQVL